jgi:hypothetical protein
LAQLNTLYGGLALDTSGNLFVADNLNNVIRQISPDGIITTVVGDGAPGYSGDGGPATSASLTLDLGLAPHLNPYDVASAAPNGIAVDLAGDIYFADSGNSVIRRAGGLLVTVEPVTTSNLAAALDRSGQGASITLQSSSNAAVSTAVQAVNGLVNPNPVTPETVTLDLGGGAYTTDTQVSTQPGITLVIENGTLVGGSPALVVNSGNVILKNITAENATNASTLVIIGGSLKIRDSTIQESTGYAQAAIQINGGTVDLGTTASPGGNTINVNGTGTLIQNTSGAAVPAVGDPFENNGVASPSIVVLNGSASGALSLSGNSAINIPGAVIVESSSRTAISVGGNARLSPAATGVSVPDPFAGLAGPSTTGLTNYGAERLTGSSSATLNPGIYSQIKVLGNASLTMNPGVYIIEGGGLTVTGNASISGSGVMIYNAGSNYPGNGGSFGGITLSGTGTFNLSAPTTGIYAGLLIFQSRQNTRALSFSGNAMAGMAGTIYAANASLSMSGNASLQSPLVVGRLSLSGNVSLTQMADGNDGSGDAVGLADTLMAGNLEVYINDPNSLFMADELARIQDAINNWDALLVPYNVSITEVSDQTLANIVIDTGTSSACGASDGVLGCFSGANGEITLIQGWNWYAGADPSQIGSAQYDFETNVTHELGHALGLGHSADPGAPMYATLATGVADRTVTVADLNIPDPPSAWVAQVVADFTPKTGTAPPDFLVFS